MEPELTPLSAWTGLDLHDSCNRGRRRSPARCRDGGVEALRGTGFPLRTAASATGDIVKGLPEAQTP